jgi:hypothetical protein
MSAQLADGNEIPNHVEAVKLPMAWKSLTEQHHLGAFMHNDDEYYIMASLYAYNHKENSHIGKASGDELRKFTAESLTSSTNPDDFLFEFRGTSCIPHPSPSY